RGASVRLPRRAQLAGGLTQQLLAAAAEQALGIGIGLDDADPGAVQQDGLRRMLDQGAVARLRLMARGDVLDQGQAGLQAALGVAHRAQAEAGVDDAAVLAQEALLQLVVVAQAFAQGGEQRLLALDVVRVADLQPAAGAQFVAVAAEDLAQLEVDLQPLALRPDHGHADQRRLEEQAQPLFALAQLAFGAAALADVLDRAVQAHRARLVELDEALQAHPTLGAAGTDQAHLEVTALAPGQHPLQGLVQHLLARRVVARQRRLHVRRAAGRVQLVEAETAVGPVHALAGQLRHPAADV